jgi:hypothetical protein
VGYAHLVAVQSDGTAVDTHAPRHCRQQSTPIAYPHRFL